MFPAVEKSVIDSIRYWAEQQDELGYETVWSIDECTDIDQPIFKKDRTYRIAYRFVDPDATVTQMLDGTEQWIEVSALAVNGTVRELWRAAESCYQQAKARGDWHCFIEDLELCEDGSFELTMGS